MSCFTETLWMAILLHFNEANTHHHLRNALLKKIIKQALDNHRIYCSSAQIMQSSSIFNRKIHPNY